MKIAFIGTTPAEEKFFAEKLRGRDVAFFSAHDWTKIDPATEILSVFVDFLVTRDVLEKLPNLKLVACRSTGFNNVDLTAAKERGIVVANTPGYGASSVAEYAFLLALMLSRKALTAISDSNTKRGLKQEQGTDISGKTVAVIGCGAIGRGFAQLAAGAGAHVIGFDPFWRDDWAAKVGVERVLDVREALARADIVSLHVPYLPENHHLIGRETLALMKSNAILVNTARGELVDTVELLRALAEKRIAAAGLDVLEAEETLDADGLKKLVLSDDADAEKLKIVAAIAALREMPNAIITNHNAYNTVEAICRINEMSVENIANFADGAVDKVFVAK